MGIQVSGKTVTALREALTATKGLMIESRAALFSKAEDAPISTDDRTKVISCMTKWSSTRNAQRWQHCRHPTRSGSATGIWRT